MDQPFPAYKGGEPYVFVCYAHEDADIVYPEIERLHSSGVNVYYDEGISPGHEWTQELADAIEGASHFLYFVSPQSVESRNCRNEIQFATTREKPVIAVHIEPTQLPGGLELSIGLAQAILKHDISDVDYQRKLGTTLGSTTGGHPSTPDASTFIRSNRSVWPTALVLVSAGLALCVFGWLYWEARPAQDLEDPTVTPMVEVLSIAVLPFRDLSAAGDQRHFSDGVAEEILNALAQTKDLKVMARAASFRFRGPEVSVAEIGTSLSVTHLLDGSVRKEGNRMRISAQLVAVSSGEHVWSEAYDATVGDSLRTQDTIARAVATALEVELGERDTRAVDPLAYESYLRGRQAWDAADFPRAIRWFEEAIESDANYADAHAHLARAVNIMGMWNDGSVTEKLAHYADVTNHAARAMQIDPNHPVARASTAFAGHYSRKLHPQTVIHEYEALIRSNPQEPALRASYYQVLIGFERFDDIVRLLKPSLEVDPFNRLALSQAANSLMYLGHFDEARLHAEEALRLYPGNWFPLGILHDIALLERDWDEAERLQSMAEQALFVWGDPVLATKIARLNAAGRLEEALAAAQEYRNIDMGARDRTFLAAKFLESGDPESALELWQRGADTYSAFVMIVRANIAFQLRYGFPHVRKQAAQLMVDPRYEALLQELNMDDESLSRIEFNFDGLF